MSDRSPIPYGRYSSATASSRRFCGITPKIHDEGVARGDGKAAALALSVLYERACGDYFSADVWAARIAHLVKAHEAGWVEAAAVRRRVDRPGMERRLVLLDAIRRRFHRRIGREQNLAQLPSCHRHLRRAHYALS